MTAGRVLPAEHVRTVKMDTGKPRMGPAHVS